MSAIAHYFFSDSPSSAGMCGYMNDANNHNDETGSFATNHTSDDSSYEDLLEGMVVGILESAPVHSIEVANNNEEEEEESSLGSQTILSSTASHMTVGGDYYHSALQQEVAAPPLPSGSYCSANNPLSISTAQSRFLELRGADEDSHSASSRTESSSLLSFQSSLLDSSISFTQLSRASSRRSLHEATINNRGGGESSLALVIRQTLSPSLPTNLAITHPRRRLGAEGAHQTFDWFANFTDNDWDEFRFRAKHVIRSLTAPPRSIRTYHLPPRPPLAFGDDLFLSTGQEEEEVVDATLMVLPGSFICQLCQNAIVGALTLDCDCGINVCTQCWEYRCATTQIGDNTFELAQELGYEIVSWQGNNDRCNDAIRKCPCCFQNVQNPLACHALDVAILQVVQGMQGNQQLGSFQRSYYKRLWQWRNEIERRQVEESSENDNRFCDEHIAQLIEEEENLWQVQHTPIRSARVRCGIPATLSFVVAMVASIGIKALAQNRSFIHRS